MTEVFESIANIFSSIYLGIVGFFPAGFKEGVDVGLIGLGVALLALFIFYFYRTLSQRNFISLNLGQYNNVEHAGLSKLAAIGFYLIEYVIAMPILLLFWFTALSVFILVLSPEKAIAGTLMLSAAIIVAIRVLSYFKEEISKDLAKLFPFITLSVFILTPGALQVNAIIGNLRELPLLFGSIFNFLFVIFVIEILLRFIYTLKVFVRSEGEENAITAILGKGDLDKRK